MQSALDTAIRQIELIGERRRAVIAASACPKAQQIVTRNQAAPMLDGMAGCAQLFARLLDASTYKRKAAETIIALRRNRAALKSMGRSHHKADAILLEQARQYRLMAARIIAAEKGEDVKSNNALGKAA